MSKHKPMCLSKNGKHCCGRDKGHKGDHVCLCLMTGCLHCRCGYAWPSKKGKKL